MAHATELVVAAGFAGKLVAGRYKLDSLIGAGAVGEVWLAEHVLMRKRYALKLVDKRYATPEVIARFEREAQAAANVSHEGIAHATDFGCDEDGCFFLVLEYVQGRSLRELVNEGALPPLRALEITRQILAALGAAHKKNVIHRDLKPENLMLAETRESGGRDLIKILDFGIAKVDGPNASGERLTRAGTVYGTPAYMSPEQALGKDIDPRADLFAVGVILFELLTGATPFPGEGLQILAHTVNTEAPPPSQKVVGIPPELDDLVRALLEKDRNDRPANVTIALGMLDRCRRALDPARPEADRASAVPLFAASAASMASGAEPPSPARSKRTLFIAGAVIALLVAVPLAIVIGRSQRDEEPRAKKTASATSADDTAEPAAVSPSGSSPSSGSGSTSSAASSSSSVSSSSSAAPSTAPLAKGPPAKKPSKKDEKGFGKLKSLFK